MKNFHLTLFIALLSATSASAQFTPFFPDEMVVTAPGTFLLESPDSQAKKVTGLSPGSVVQYIEAYNNGEYVQIDTTTSEYAPWLKVRFKNKTGYVYGSWVTGSIVLAYEEDMIESLPPMQWYGVYARDSFADEIRKIDLTITEGYNEMFGTNIKTLKTNQKSPSKFLIGSLTPLKQGYAGPLGIFAAGDLYNNNGLYPGSVVSVFPGQEPDDTLMRPTWQLAASGCARYENDMMSVSDYKLYLIDFNGETTHRQDLSPWVQTESPEVNPNVSVIWYGDLDMDNKPDIILQDYPYMGGARASLFLSSKARPGEYLHKVSEHFWPGE